MNSINALVADVGGTNIRLAIADLKDFRIKDIITYQCSDFDNIDAAIALYLEKTNHSVDYACIDVACPVSGDTVDLTNNHWCFSQQQLSAQFGFKKLVVINDFTAIAMSVPFISEENKVKIGGGVVEHQKPIAIFGAGTGLGVAHLVHANHKWIPLGGEGGHVDFAPIDEDEINVLKALQRKYQRVSAEQLLSGLGLVQIYQAICLNLGEQEKPYEPADITSHALNNTDPVAVKTLDLFCRVLGSFGGNLALNMLTTGGVYIAGGIVPRFVEYVQKSDFRRRFDAKGRFESLVSNIPVYIVTEEQPGLIGCAAYLKQEIL